MSKLEKTGEKHEVERNPDGTIKKGFSLNPNGRPLGSISFKTKFYRLMEKIAEKNNTTLEDIEEQLLLVGYKKAQEGEFNFYRDAMDRIHGKPIQPIDATTNGKDLNPLVIEERVNQMFDNDK